VVAARTDGALPTTVDLNADVGEVDDPAQLELALLEVVTSANIATGGHAGNPAVMDAAVRAALRLGVRIGAHPSYPDRAGFGRQVLRTPPEVLLRELLVQVGALDSIARSHGARVHHVKPHGALYHQTTSDKGVAQLLAEVAGKFPDVALVVQAGLPPVGAATTGVRTITEAFADRGYRSDGSLVPRGEPGDLLTDPARAAEQAVSIATDRRVRATDGSWVEVSAQTLCLHGDTPGAPGIAEAVRTALESAGVLVEANT
jgi:UPF0271 protein